MAAKIFSYFDKETYGNLLKAILIKPALAERAEEVGGESIVEAESVLTGASTALSDTNENMTLIGTEAPDQVI